MLPRLDAEERLAHSEATALGSGSLEPDDARMIASRLESLAGVRELLKVEAASPDLLARSGIRLIREPTPTHG